MKNFMSLALLTLVAAGVASAIDGSTVAAPEIGAGSAAAAVGLVAGVLLVMRARRKQ